MTLVFVFSLLFLLSCQAIKDLDIIRITEVDDSQNTSAARSMSASSGISENKDAVNVKEEKSNSEEVASGSQKNVINAYIEDDIPDFLRAILINEIKKATEENTDAKFQEISDADKISSGDFTVNFKKIDVGSSEEAVIGSYVLVPVSSFYTYCDNLQFDDFVKFWQGDENSLNYIVNNKSNSRLILNRQILNILEKVLGECKIENLETADDYKEVKQKLIGPGNYFSVISFEEIIREYKVLNVNGQSIFDRESKLINNPFAVQITISGDDSDKANMIVKAIDKDKITNRKTDKLTILNMTGCTALVRGTANKMEEKGVLYPGEKIAEILKDADITHISNEITFVEGNPRDREKEIIFSSDPKYIDLLKYVGADVIELTGNHMNDYGPQWMIYTLEMYEKEGWQYFAGGRNLEEAYKPARFNINGNKIAFLGCNQFGPASYWATDKKAGAAPPDYEVYEKEIKELKEEGYNVIFTFQHIEVYDYLPVAAQVKDFRRIAAAGADIVSGSQAHHPQAIEFYNNAAVFYGLGNLFFDQMYNDEVRQGIITKHIFYEGKYINTVLITTMLEDYCQPRLTEENERLNILSNVFNASKMEKYK
ncbi:MAG: CapA family protein [Actinobacteria bacterium]|nr:CapA family protein [Actinomycetota bacterium]